MKIKLSWFLALIAVSVFTADATTFYVAANGNDGWSGTLAAPNAGKTDGPFATLPSAISAARKRTPGETATILLRNGTHPLAEAVKLGAADSSLTIAAFENEKPILSGGRRITGWKNIRGNLWQASVPAVREAKWNFRQLFINGQRATRARTPNEGSYLRMDGPRFIDKPIHFKFKAGDIKPAWAGDPDVEVIGLEKWTVFRQHIAAVLTASNVVRLTGIAAPHTRESSAQYYIENTPDALDAPGEWHLDRKQGLVSYLARSGEDLANAEIFAPLLDELVILEGDATAKKPVENISFRGLTFSHTDWNLPTNGYVDTQAAVGKRGAIRAEFARNISAEDCTFTHLANYAIEFGRGAQHCRAIGNEITDLGAGGVRLGETSVRANDFDASRDHVITDNHMHHLGLVFPPAVGVLILQSGNNRVAHNHIHDLYYTAVSLGWTWGYRASPCSNNIVEWNHMHDIGKSLLSDMGAVYTLGPQPGTAVRHNLIHDVNAFTYGGWGLYTDEGSTGIIMERNIVYRCKNAGFHQHYGKENIIRNNVFAFNKENQLMRSREEDHTSFYFTNNIVYYAQGNLLGSTWKNDRFVMDRNLYWRPNGTNQADIKFSGATFDQWKARGHDTNSLVADPRFVDGMKADFRLQPDSPAPALGIQPINLTGVGVRPKAKR